MAPVEERTAPEKLWLSVEGRAVDVTDFKTHPGGVHLFKKCTGRDVTHHFRAMHPNQAKVRARLATLPDAFPTAEKKISPKGHDAVASAALEKLEADMRKRGIFNPPSLIDAFTRISELLILFGISAAIGFKGKNMGGWMSILTTAVASLLWGFTAGRCGWLQHDAGHRSLFTSKAANRVVQAVFLGLGMSGAPSEWNWRHNAHHAVPNEHGADPDLNTTPILMFYKDAVAYRPLAHQRRVPSWILRLQAFLFTPLLCPLVGLAWALYAHPKACLRRKEYGQFFLLVISHVVRLFVAVSVTATYWQAAAFIAVVWTVGPGYLFTLFAMSHTTRDVRYDMGELDWTRATFRTTTDASSRSAFASWLTGNLNCQVAHHLWPNLPTSRLSGLTDDIAKLAQDIGETYYETSVPDALKTMYANLSEVSEFAMEDKKNL